jgi:hypothetical protein
MILEYHTDGIRFWQDNKVHHPFLLDGYPFDRRKGGVPYHRNFSKLDFTSKCAKCFSFVELLNVPTTGNTGDDKECFFKMPDKCHLNRLEDAILHGEKKFVIVNQTLAHSIDRIREKLGVLGELQEILAGKEAPGVVFQNDNVVLYNGYSFAHAVPDVYLTTLRKKILEFCSEYGQDCRISHAAHVHS